MPAHDALTRVRTALAPLLDDAGLLTGSAIGERHLHDWSGQRGVPLAVVRPRSTAEVSAVMRALHALRQPVVVQGGMTGLVGAAVPQAQEVVLSLERMQHIGPVDEQHGAVLVEAGALLQHVQERVAQQGWMFPVDIGARGSCQIGGLIATNAGGNRVLRWGMTRASVRGLEVVLADGRVLSRLAPMLKDNAGYDLRQLFIGSEGTLGVITRALLDLTPTPKSSQTALVSLQDFDQVTALLLACRRGLGSNLTSFEVMWRDFVEAAAPLVAGGSAAQRLAGPLLVLLEAMGHDAAADEARFEECMAQVLERSDGIDVVLAQSLADAQRLWALRDASGEAAQRLAPWVGFDVSMPLHEMHGFVDAAWGQLRALGTLQTQTYGHVGDGNLHLVVGPLADDAQRAAVKRLVHEATAARGGSISGEHGIGMLKKEHLGLTRSAVEIEVMRAIRHALDPHGILNPGRVFDPASPGA